MKSITLLFIVISFAFFGCNQGQDTSDDNTTIEEQTTPMEEQTETTPETPQVNPPHGEPGHVHEGEEATPGEGATGNLNPPHGEPGHRCDIAVGAPLPE